MHGAVFGPRRKLAPRLERGGRTTPPNRVDRRLRVMAPARRVAFGGVGLTGYRRPVPHKEELYAETSFTIVGAAVERRGDREAVGPVAVVVVPGHPQRRRAAASGAGVGPLAGA